MSDDGDRAAEYESLERASAINLAAKNMAKRSMVSLIYCRECQEEIPKKRREAEPGCELCVECKAWEEKGGGFWP